MTYHPRKTLVAIDRDNTIMKDHPDGYFGSRNGWKDRLEFCEGAIEGLQRLTQADNVYLAVVTSQVGVAKGVLTEEQVIGVNRFIDDVLRGSDVEIDSWQYSAFVDQKGADRWRNKGIETVRDEYVLGKHDLNARLVKPLPGLVERAAHELGLDWNDIDRYVIGDRTSDVETGLNAGGYGILVIDPAIQRRTEGFFNTEVVDQMMQDPIYHGRVHKAVGINQAAEIILGRRGP